MEEQTYLTSFACAKRASKTHRDLRKFDDVLRWLAYALEKRVDDLIAVNRKDLETVSQVSPLYDRLRLTKRRINEMSRNLRAVANLPSPLGEVLSETEHPNRLLIRKMTVPIGVVGVIFEAKPFIITDICALCLKAGNACVLKGSDDAQNTNEAIINIVHRALREFYLEEELVTLLPRGQEAVAALLEARDFVDVLIPQGSRQLCDYVRCNAAMPVIRCNTGVVHTFVDKSAIIEKASLSINYSKTHPVNANNALDCLLIHCERLQDLPLIVQPLADSHVFIYADTSAIEALHGRYPKDLIAEADDDMFDTEFLSYKLAVKTVGDISEAIEHIDHHSAHICEAIISEDGENIALFQEKVDAATIFVNTATSFSDGAQLGMGAEIGVSTQKIHARGPIGLNELVSYKWIVSGSGLIRKD